MKIYLTRHGQTEWNLEGRMQGHLNSDLTELGKTQAQWLGKRLEHEKIDIICCSTSGRAFETASIIKGNRNVEIKQYEGLMEIDAGSWQGMKHEDIEGHYGELYHQFWHQPDLFESEGHETFSQLIRRGRKTLDEITQTYVGKNILIVSHGVLLKGILASIKALPVSEFWEGPFMKSCCLNLFEYKNHSYEVLIEGDTSHYE